LQASAAAAEVGEKTKVAADAAAAGVVGAGDALDAVGTDGWCSQRHRLSFNIGYKGSKYV